MKLRPWFTACLLLVVATLLVQSLALSPPSRMAPLWALLPTVVLLLVQLGVETSPDLARRLSVLRESGVVSGVQEAQAAARKSKGTEPSADRRRREVRLVFWLAWLVGLMYLVGFLGATVLFLFPFLRSESRLGWGRSLLLTGLGTIVIYVAFGIVARVPFPPGALF